MIVLKKKYKIQGTVPYPHIGQFLRQYFSKNGVNRAQLSRELGVSNSASTGYMKQESLQFGILWKMSVALNYNLLADLASRLPIPFASPREALLEIELKALQEEIKELQIENKTYKSLLTAKQ
jgi:hypothetical protein